MKITRKTIASALIAGGLLSAFALAPADDTPKSTPVSAKETRKAEAVASLSKASDLISFGRGQMAESTGLTGYKSPEALVAAGGMLLRADEEFGGKMAPLGSEPTDENGKAIKAEEGKVPTLKQEAEGLFDEARLLVAGNKAKETAIEKLIKEAKTIDNETRGALGYPRAAQRVIPPGAHHWYKIPFVSGLPGSIAMRSTGTSKLHFEVLGDGGGRMFQVKGANAIYQWNVGRGTPTKMITVNITNIGNAVATYQMVTN